MLRFGAPLKGYIYIYIYIHMYIHIYIFKMFVPLNTFSYFNAMKLSILLS